jgi:hypothetical protein
MRLENFRCFEGVKELTFNSGVNYFVGNNNCGKTTIFRAIEFLKSAKTKDGWITKGKEDEDVSVEITLEGENLADFLEQDDLKKFQPYLINGSKLRIRKSSELSSWKDIRGKDKEISIKNVSAFNPETGIFENPFGVGDTVSALFDSQFVWSDINSDEYNNFGKTTTIVSKLINNITENFRKSDKWLDFEKAHKETFGDEGLVSVLNGLQSRIEEVMKAQYGETKVNFSFGIPTIDNFFKTGQILLEDNGIQTDISEKGTGMQRALALTLIQVYSQIGEESREITKPILFFIDEPETFLHPSAQDKLLQSLNQLSNNHQIFITTHSPYLLKNFNSSTNKLSIFSRNEHAINIEEDIQLNLFPYSPSWGEINYKAFGVVSEEFHNELFGLLHNKAREDNKTYDGGNRKVVGSIASFDDWLIEQDSSNLVDSNHQNKNPRDGRVDKTMSSYIRNYIDHPGNDESLPEGCSRNKPTIGEIRTSIESMMKIYTDNY